jgi:epoxyqueuosine reductase QueG
MGRPTRRPVYVHPEYGDMWKCTKCTNVLPTGAFDKNRSAHSGISSWCKECSGKYHSERHYSLTERIQDLETYVAELEARLELDAPDPSDV